MAKLEVTFDATSFRKGLKAVLRNVEKAARLAPAKAAAELERDAKPHIPILTGRLRDSSVIRSSGKTSVQLAWTAGSGDGFHYAEKQHEEVFHHVDGVFAARWVDKAIIENDRGQKYVRIVGDAVRVGIALASRRAG